MIASFSLWQVCTGVGNRVGSLQHVAGDKPGQSDGYVLLLFSLRAFVQTFNLFWATLFGQ